MDGVNMNEQGYRDLIKELVGTNSEAYLNMRDECMEYCFLKNMSETELALFQKAFELGYLSAYKFNKKQ